MEQRQYLDLRLTEQKWQCRPRTSYETIAGRSAFCFDLLNLKTLFLQNFYISLKHSICLTIYGSRGFIRLVVGCEALKDFLLCAFIGSQQPEQVKDTLYGFLFESAGGVLLIFIERLL